MELGIAHSSRFQHNDTCNVINPLDAGRGGNSLWLSSQMFLAGGRPCQLLASRGGRLPDRPKAAEAGEEAAGAGDVAGDLSAQRFGAGEFLFFAEALPEAEVHALGGDVAGKIEQVSFDAEGSAVEGGAHADVGDGAAAAGFAFEESACYVDAAGGQKLLFRLQVQRGERKAAAGAGAGNNFAGEGEGAAEEPGGVGDVGGGDFAANGGAGDDFAIEGDGRNDFDGEPVARTQLAEQGYVAALPVTEAKIFTHQHGAHVQATNENLIDEFLRGEAREIEGEGEDDGGLETDGAEPIHALGVGR